jgi:hypothetical protein
MEARVANEISNAIVMLRTKCFEWKTFAALLAGIGIAKSSGKIASVGLVVGSGVVESLVIANILETSSSSILDELEFSGGIVIPRQRKGGYLLNSQSASSTQSAMALTRAYIPLYKVQIMFVTRSVC